MISISINVIKRYARVFLSSTIDIKYLYQILITIKIVKTSKIRQTIFCQFDGFIWSSGHGKSYTYRVIHIEGKHGTAWICNLREFIVGVHFHRKTLRAIRLRNRLLHVNRSLSWYFRVCLRSTFDQRKSYFEREFRVMRFERKIWYSRRAPRVYK